MGLPYSWIDDINRDILDILLKEFHKGKITINQLLKHYIEIKVNKRDIIKN